MPSILRNLCRLSVATVALAMTSPAMAEWKTVETKNFIYHSQDKIETIQENVTQLETLDTLVRALTANSKQPSTVKVRIFELTDMAMLNRYLGSFGVGGFYNNNDVGPYIFTFRQNLRRSNTARKTQTSAIVWAPQVRQHEYIHHYMYQYFYANYPSWYSEGFAEYYGSMTFPDENIVEIGHAPHFRMDAIRSGAWVDVEKLLTARSYEEFGDDLSPIYAQGWLLTHMAARKPERGKQLNDYLSRLVKGESYADAAKAAFGDLKQLNEDLRAHRNNLEAVRLSLKPLNMGEVKIVERSKFESDLFEYQMRLNMGIAEKDLGVIRSRVRELRAEDMNHPLGLEVQARLAQNARDWKDELELGERMLQIDPESAMGKYFKGHALVELVENQSDESAYAPGRELLAEAARADLNNPEPMIDFYRSYLKGDGIPPAEAQNALMAAFTLLPGHRTLRQYVARDFEWREMYDEAIFVLEPLAFGSFDGDEKSQRRRDKAITEAVEKYGRAVVVDTPKQMMDRLVAKRDGKWDPVNNTILEQAAAAPETATAE